MGREKLGQGVADAVALHHGSSAGTELGSSSAKSMRLYQLTRDVTVAVIGSYPVVWAGH